jgi:dihydroflavonol-4-reductase
MSDVRDVAAIHVAALENEKANGYNKVSPTLAPTFLLKFMANFNSEMKGMLPFIGNTIEADISNTMTTFHWKPIPFEKIVLDAVKFVEEVLKK